MQEGEWDKLLCLNGVDFMSGRQYKVAITVYPLFDTTINPVCVEHTLALQTAKEEKTVSLYIHIPFCSSICTFCIYSRIKIDLEIMECYVKAIKKEIRQYGNSIYMKGKKVGAIFLGGGTPTCLSKKQLREIINTCRESFALTCDLEISVEGNILTATDEMLYELSQAGVTRVSIGTQTFDDRFRKILALQKTGNDIVDWIAMAKKHDFNSVSIDLMYGLPGQTVNDWEKDIITALKVHPDHISVYELYVASGSELYRKGKRENFCTDDALYNMYLLAEYMLLHAGYLNQIIPEYHYPTHKAKFWEMVFDGYSDNIAVGASAFGYIDGISYQNYEDVKKYINRVESGKLPVERVSQRAEKLQRMERYIALTLRRGYVDKKEFVNIFSCTIESQFGEVIKELMDNDYILENAKEYRLTQRGKYLQGDISVKFFESTFSNCTNLKRRMSIGQYLIPQLV